VAKTDSMCEPFTMLKGKSDLKSDVTALMVVSVCVWGGGVEYYIE